MISVISVTVIATYAQNMCYKYPNMTALWEHTHTHVHTSYRTPHVCMARWLSYGDT